MVSAQVDYSEVEATSASIAGSGGTAALNINITSLPTGLAVVRLHEVVLDSLSTDFDVEIFEDVALSALNRVFRVQNLNLHTVQVLGVGKGVQYQDRDVSLATDQAQFHVRLTNNQVGAATVTIRLRYQVYSAR